MKIVYTIVGTFNSGGMERVLANKANYLAKQEHELTIITTDQKGRKPYFELDSRIEQIDLGINYTTDIDKRVLQKLIAYFIKQKKHKQRLSACLQQLKADVVISMFDHDASFLYKIKDGSRKVLEIHFSRYKKLQYERKGILGLIDQFRSKRDLSIARQYDRFVVLTEEDKLYWGGLKNIKVIPNANSFKPIDTADLSTKQVIAVGRYDYQKRFDDLIKAWQIVHQQHADWVLSIYGNGPLKPELEKSVIDLGLEKVVQLQLPVKNIEKEYRHSSILAMTSRYEGLPMALLEGQVCGLPLVSYACKCGPKDIIEDGKNGFLIEEGDIKSLAEKLILLIEQPHLRIQMGLESELRSENFTEDRIMKKWLDLFSSLIKA